MKSSWLMRAYPHNIDRKDIFINNGIVALGWPLLGDLTKVDSDETLRGLILDKCKEEPSPALSAFRIMKKMQIGDNVLLPHGPIVYFGKITSDYFYDKEVESNEIGYPHQRKVEWIGEIARDKIDKELRSSFRTQLSAAHLDHHQEYIEKLIQKIIDNKAQENSANMRTFEYPVRANLFAKVTIPEDITKQESERLGQFIQTLYFQ